jgi:hypothetical protein
MPMLFISYKRGTAAVAPLMERLRAEHYRLWFDRDEIHLGDSDWQARIDQGLGVSDAVILNITPAATQSEAVKYEVRKARELGKPIFPIVLERITDYDAAIRDLGLPDKQHIEDFTDVTLWDRQIERLLTDLRARGLRVTHHDLRCQRDTEQYALHQQYLRKLVDEIGTLDLAQINPDAGLVNLEDVYIDSPTQYGFVGEIADWKVVDWSLTNNPELLTFTPISRKPKVVPFMKPNDQSFEYAPFEVLAGKIEARIDEFRRIHPNTTYSEYSNENLNGSRDRVVFLHLQHFAATCRRLVVLGNPGSGKSTFAKFLALCLAGAQIDSWARSSLNNLEAWTHGNLTPIYIHLRKFVNSSYFPKQLNESANADHLWRYIVHEVLGEELAGYRNELKQDLESGGALIILDGLDEVPYTEGQLKLRRKQLESLAISLNNSYSASRILVTSRIYAYQGWELQGFFPVTIASFEDAHRVDLATRLYRAAGLDAASASDKAQKLTSQLRNVHEELKDRPLFVTMMAQLYLKGSDAGLPTRRGALYRQSILLLLERWTKHKPDAQSLLQILGDKSVHDLYMRLAAFAYEVHRDYGHQPGTPQIDEPLLYKHLKPLGRERIAELIPYLSENAGVLVSPGQNDQRDVFHFAHRTFQEYLAAEHLVAECARADSFITIRQHIESKPGLWRLPCALAGDVLADTNRRVDLWNLLDDLLDEVPSAASIVSAHEQAEPDRRWWAVWLAATVTQEQDLASETNLRKGEKAIRQVLVDWLVRLFDTYNEQLPPEFSPRERALCGRVLSALGDPRKGVGLRADGLPNIDWVSIPDDGEWIYQEDKHQPLPSFQISRYPVTYAQFRVFVDAPDYGNARWWEGLPEEQQGLFGENYRTQEMKDQQFQYDNHPRENVSWYQVGAFTRWLSDKLGYEVTLPTEQQWEKAARGTDGREYPYEGAFDAAKGNTSETGIGQTTAVGLFPNGKSPYGILDMSGNVWQWCLNKYDNPDQTQIDDSGDTRVLRGGPWDMGYYDAAITVRFQDNPFYGYDLVGLRLVCAAIASLNTDQSDF